MNNERIPENQPIDKSLSGQLTYGLFARLCVQGYLAIAAPFGYLQEMTNVKSNMGCVYFFKHNNISPIKIGHTKSETVKGRLSSFLTYAPYGGDVVGIIRSYYPCVLESEIHKELHEYRLYGEWFDIDLNKANEIISKFRKMEGMREYPEDIFTEMKKRFRDEEQSKHALIHNVD